MVAGAWAVSNYSQELLIAAGAVVRWVRRLPTSPTAAGWRRISIEGRGRNVTAQENRTLSRLPREALSCPASGGQARPLLVF